MADGSTVHAERPKSSSSKMRFSFVSSSNSVHPVVEGSSSEAFPSESTTEQKEAHDRRCCFTLCLHAAFVEGIRDVQAEAGATAFQAVHLPNLAAIVASGCFECCVCPVCLLHATAFSYTQRRV